MGGLGVVFLLLVLRLDGLVLEAADRSGDLGRRPDEPVAKRGQRVQTRTVLARYRQGGPGEGEQGQKKD
jgi:hypothetical protein